MDNRKIRNNFMAAIASVLAVGALILEDIRFHRSVETIHRYFRVVLKGVFCLYKHVVRLPGNLRNDNNLILVIIRIVLELLMELIFVHLFQSKSKEGWEGSAHDSRVLDNALHRSRGLKIPEGAEPFWSFETQVEVVLACCVLHNHIVGVDPDDPIMGDTTSEVDSQRIVHQTHQTRQEAREESREWNDKRDRISEVMWTDYVTNRTMAKNKEKEGKGSQFRWSTPMNVMLLDILEDEALKGNKPSNTFKPQSFARVAKEISEKFEITCLPDHVSNRLRTIKTTWKTIQSVRNNSGFGWDDNTHDEYVMAHPTHAQYLNKKIEFYDQMAIVVGKDLATGSYAFSWGDETSPNPVVELDEESNYSEVAAQLKETAITFKNQGPVDTNELYEAVMSTGGFAEEMLASAFDYMIQEEKVGRAFMAKAPKLRKLWLENYFSKNM
uniref:Myb/SANT-like domain-containing protein n=1 Tax=Fagus sylvatica TaxID=28930 RepID=A0A2N9HVQ3_FAGSY